ncbi:MAG: hypothetical protein KBD31_05420 [Proteobacteria bacterium]|nr:hypothetical protein [Pseudomonadota bacterium]
MKKFKLLFVFCLLNTADAEILNLDTLLECARNANKGRVISILSDSEEFSDRMSKLSNIFDHLQKQTDIHFEKEEMELFPSLVTLKIILFAHKTIDIENAQLKDVLAIIETVNICIDEILLKISKNKNIEQANYLEEFVGFKSYLNGISTPLKDLIENHSQKCSTREVFEASGKRFIEDVEKKLAKTSRF